MAPSIKAFGYGVEESFNVLVDNAPNIIIGTAFSAGVGYMVGGTCCSAWLAARVTSFVLGAIYAANPATVGTDIKALSHRTSRSVGNIVAAVWIPYFMVFGLQKLAP